ncbi:SusC/RagA family TonB-linked outer membrane protein [Pedobacter mendelii]|uniref:SusC/RagA family TonB-linked outer membrane protein n=1 Tax=Pedobacter mendelii TaxID=1908240 RepID=A0ABQ2BG10_9SPHI|nr:SusC/RagA family TonB-linked outer membrane protein [Pedobacter mendelii]GGI23724.1 SusC/RagA family TonB-linked outer membrane protein [Pedobacter mendelii]
MRNKSLLKEIAIIISICASSLIAVAQKKGKIVVKNDSSLTKIDPLILNKVNFPLNIAVLPENTTSSTQAVYTSSLVKQPVSNVLNALTGRLAGLNTQQITGQPGFDGVVLSLRGRTPIVLIDGIPRQLTSTDLEGIESVTVLKDAMATAMLGVRGANGAVLITTKNGVRGVQQISLTVQSAFQKPLSLLKPLNSFDYATLRNEAVANELRVNPNFNTGLRFSDADLTAYQSHSDPVGHPDVNWYNQILKSSAPLNRYSLNVSGGNKTVRYFTEVEHLYQDGLLKTSDINTYNTNQYFSRYLIRSNVDIDITKNVSAGIHVFGSIANENEPGVTTATLFNSFLTTPNNAYNIYNANGSYGGNTTFRNNLQGQAFSSGYQQNYSRNLIADFYVKRTLDEVTPGLYVKASVAYTSSLSENINRSKPVIAYQQTISNTGDVSYGPALTPTSAQINTNLISGTTGLDGLGQFRQNYFELSTGWNRTFNNAHDFNVAVLANSDSKSDGANLPYTIQGISARASYTYKKKYIAEFAEAYNGSNYYLTDNHFKYGFFPVFGLAWNIANEDFIQRLSWVNTLKLSANFGRTGNDNPGYFVYLQRYNNAAAPYFGTSNGANTSLAEGTLANPNITYEKADKFNISLQASVLNNRLGFTVDYYYNKFSDLLIQRGQNTSLIGNSYPNENIGRNQYSGMEFQLSWQNPKSGDFSYYASFNAGFQQSKVLYANEVAQPYDYMQRTGQKVGQAFGYVAEGFFQDQADVNNAKQNGVGVVTGYIAQPGDIKYQDQNKDGLINQFDQVPIGPKGPYITYGADLGFKYKNFDMSFLFQGAANYNVYLNGNSYWEFQNNGFGQAYEQQLGRFTSTNTAGATYPRLSIGNNSNNQTFSTFWYRKADFIRLKNLQVAYTLPIKYAKAVKLSSVKLFANGVNLFTVTSLKGGLDPEVYNGLYPIQRVFNFGITAKL